jgi:ABC-2 type transport system permease protein
MSANTNLQRVNEWSPLRGLANLLRKENRLWWGTRRWWINALVWTSMIGGLVGIMLFILPSVAQANGDPNVAEAGGPIAFGLEMGRTVFFELGAMAIALGIIVLSQDMIVDEKQSGLTEWLLSKPVSRRAYILAKLVASLAAMLVLLIALPAGASYGLLTLRLGAPFPATPFLGGLAILVVHSLFYLTLMVMLGALFNSRPPILAVALGVLLGGSFLSGILPPLAYVTPWILGKTASLVAAGQPVPNDLLWAPLIASLLWSIGFVMMGILLFEKAEF